MTLKEMERLVALQNELNREILTIKHQDIMEYTISYMLETWCKKNGISPKIASKNIYKRLRRKK